MNHTQTIRQASFAGTFYSADKLILERELSLLLESSPLLELSHAVRAIIAPHAGYVYSGGVAARAYRQILDVSYQYIVVVAPSHQEEFSFNSIYPGVAYHTPLGDIPIDLKLAERLTEYHPDIRFSEKGHSQSEYSLEVQLPFIKWSNSKFSFVPIVMGLQSEEQIEILSRALKKNLPSEGTLIVASTDLSHDHPDGQARMLDQVAQIDIQNFDEDKLWNDIMTNHTEMCGFGPVIIAMKVSRQFGAKESNVLLYRNSGDITGNKDNVVGYLSAVIY